MLQAAAKFFTVFLFDLLLLVCVPVAFAVAGFGGFALLYEIQGDVATPQDIKTAVAVIITSWATGFVFTLGLCSGITCHVRGLC